MQEQEKELSLQISAIQQVINKTNQIPLLPEAYWLLGVLLFVQGLMDLSIPLSVQKLPFGMTWMVWILLLGCVILTLKMSWRYLDWTSKQYSAYRSLQPQLLKLVNRRLGAFLTFWVAITDFGKFDTQPKQAIAAFAIWGLLNWAMNYSSNVWIDRFSYLFLTIAGAGYLMDKVVDTDISGLPFILMGASNIVLSWLLRKEQVANEVSTAA